MKKKDAKKLSLAKETVRLLSEDQRSRVAAGVVEASEDTCSRPCTWSCHEPD